VRNTPIQVRKKVGAASQRIAAANAGGPDRHWYYRAAGQEKGRKREHEYAFKDRASELGHTRSPF
jgi:hypothetical protein